MPVGKAEGGQRLTSGLDGLFLRNGLDRVHEQLFDDYRRDRRGRAYMNLQILDLVPNWQSRDA